MGENQTMSSFVPPTEGNLALLEMVETNGPKGQGSDSARFAEMDVHAEGVEFTGSAGTIVRASSPNRELKQGKGKKDYYDDYYYGKGKGKGKGKYYDDDYYDDYYYGKGK